MTAQPASAEIAALDRAVAELRPGAERWSRLGAADRAALMASTHASIRDHAAPWARAAAAAKHLGSELWQGEEWMSGPYAALVNVAAIVRTLDAVAAGRSPLEGLVTATAPGGRTTLKVLPTDLRESVLLHGFSAEIWMPPGTNAEQMRATAGLGARRVGDNGGVGLVLGAGNVSSIGPLDVLYELVAHNRASVLKLNPTFAALLPVLRDAFAPLVEFGVLRIVNGGAEVGSHLIHHSDITHVHITGSRATHDTIVWGGAEESRPSGGGPVLDKEITSELGGVSPIVVVPGRWSKADLRFQAEHVATQRLHNAGHNCISGQILILSSSWDQRAEFLDTLRTVLDELPNRAPWYPGSDRKVELAERAYPTAEARSGRLLVEVDEDTSQEALTTEYFAPVLGHTSLPGIGARFLRAAVAFANERLDGTLGAGIVVAPADRRSMGPEFDEAVAELRYGTIGVNVWSALGFLVPGLPWGAYPGHTLDAVGSGIGVVHNAHLVEGTERAVLTGPFRPFPRSVLHGEFALSPKPPWFVTARRGTRTSRKLTDYARRPSWPRLLGVVASAFRA